MHANRPADNGRLCSRSRSNAFAAVEKKVATAATRIYALGQSLMKPSSPCPVGFLATATRVALLSSACAAFLVLSVHAAPAQPTPGRKTNLVFILTDNQGAWTLGCYGNKDIRTPHIDRLAAGGIRFTRALSSNPVCSPTRATFLTGLIPSQHGVHSFLDPKFMMEIRRAHV